ncbi:MAG: glycosyltransferase family 9 protein [Bacteroidales bacterium]|nr:glycosyltransferase family 9 protein [Bacteroidales bacterium]
MKPFRKVLAIRLSALGDICMTLPVLDSVSRAYPDVQFTLLTSKAGAIVAGTVLHQGNLTVKAIDKRNYNGLSGLNRLYQELKALDVDGVADLHDVLRTKWVDLRFSLSGKPVKKIRKGRSEKKALTKGAIRRQLQTSIDRYRQVFSELGMDCAVDYDGTAHAAQLKDKPCAVSPDRMTLGVAPFAQHRGKVYPEKLMRQALSLLVEELPQVKIYLFGGPDEKTVLDIWVADHPDHIVNLAGSQTIEDDLRCMANLKLMLSMDSANMHLSSLVGLRCVSIWGATHRYAGFLGYRQSEEDCIELPLPCRPCSIYGNKPCKYSDYRCLTQIKPETVASRIKEILTQ